MFPRWQIMDGLNCKCSRTEGPCARRSVYANCQSGNSKSQKYKLKSDTTPCRHRFTTNIYICKTENLAEQLGLVKGDEQEIKLVTFGSKKTKGYQDTVNSFENKTEQWQAPN